MSSRQRAIHALRVTGLLPLVERGRYAMKRVQDAPARRRFVRANPGEPLPPTWLMYDAFGAVDVNGYWRSGQIASGYIASLVLDLDGPLRIGEWGAGPGRVLRHFRGTDRFSAVAGSDYNGRSVTWCTEHLPGAEWTENRLAPPIGWATDSMDIVYAISVFTHLDEATGIAWRDELLRIVRPGGRLIVTLHGDRFRHLLLDRELRHYDTDGCVVRSRVAEGSRAFVAFHSPSYVRERWARGMRELLHDTSAPAELAGNQDVWMFEVFPGRPQTAGS